MSDEDLAHYAQKLRNQRKFIRAETENYFKHAPYNFQGTMGGLFEAYDRIYLDALTANLSEYLREKLASEEDDP